MIKTPDIMLTSIETITAFNCVTGAYKYTLDELQNVTIQNNEEKTPITGKGGRVLSNLKRNKAVTISGTNGLVSCGLLESQTGGAFENKATDVMWTDYLVVDSQHKAKTTYKAIGTSGSEIDKIYIRNKDGVVEKELTQNSTAGEGTYKYTPGTKEIEFHTDVPEGTEVLVHYKRKITADVLANSSDKYSGKDTLYIDALGEDRCAKTYRVQIYVPKADFSGEFSLELGENQTVQAFEAESLASVCGGKSDLWTYTVFGVDTADAE